MTQSKDDVAADRIAISVLPGRHPSVGRIMPSTNPRFFIQNLEKNCLIKSNKFKYWILNYSAIRQNYLKFAFLQVFKLLTFHIITKYSLRIKGILEVEHHHREKNKELQPGGWVPTLQCRMLHYGNYFVCIVSWNRQTSNKHNCNFFSLFSTRLMFRWR